MTEFTQTLAGYMLKAIGIGLLILIVIALLVFAFITDAPLNTNKQYDDED